MPLNSIQLYLQSILDGLPIPGSTTTLEAQITPPVTQDLDGPIAFVWGGSMRTVRQTGPRGNPGKAGFKHQQWDADVWLVYLTNPDDPELDQEFPLIVDAILAQLWSTPEPLFITDPTTGLNTQLLSVGEEYRLEYAQVHTPATLRMLYYTAHLTVSLYEAVNA